MNSSVDCRPCAQELPSALERKQPSNHVCAVIVAGGNGVRFGNPRGKQLVSLCGMPMVCWSVLACDRAPSIDAIVLVAPPARKQQMLDAIAHNLQLRCPISFAQAGRTRQESVASGLESVPDGYDIVAIHDGARPAVLPQTIEQVIARLLKDSTLGGAIAACPSVDTLKIVENSLIVSTPDRSLYWCAQTPQVFHLRALYNALSAAQREGYVGTDDASLVERYGSQVACVQSPRSNIKVTHPEDLVIAEALLERRFSEESRLGEGIRPS